MGNIDRRRLGVAKTRRGPGHAGRKRTSPIENNAQFISEVDAIEASPARRADDLAGGREGSGEAAVVVVTAAALEAYQGKRWPLAKRADEG